mgnify:CR=1 FL=1
MPLRELAEKRRRWVDANRENGFEDGIKRLLIDLYPDNAHFIYELLQNAEDNKANNISFILSNDDIEVEHDGKKIFDFNDVDSITSIGVSTKRDDKTAIGKFGVGFKAVFAYTNTPEIHSGGYHFRITDLVVPEPIEQKTQPSSKTCFVFPFDNPSKPAVNAISEIERELRAVDDSALLFLSNISKIEYILSDGYSLGSIERKEIKDGIIKITTTDPEGNDQVSYWLRYSDKAAVVDGDGKSSEYNISIAYKIEKITKEELLKSNEWRIVPVEPGKICIYFPAEKETSNLKFHINAPFASTVARDSVRDCEENNQLRDAIAELAVKTLSDIRKRKLLVMDFLSVLPNKHDNLPIRYEPIRKALVSAFQQDKFTITKSGRHAPAENLYRGSASISNIINDSDLSMLTGFESPLWAANAPQQNQRPDKFLESLNIDKWDKDELEAVFNPSSDEETSLVERWITEKPDKWLMRLYVLLYDMDITVDNELRLVRTTNDDHVMSSEAFFVPDDESVNLPLDIRFVKPELYTTSNSKRDNQARVFLEELGVRTYDAKAKIDLQLAKYKHKAIDEPNVEHFSDIRLFVEYVIGNTFNIEMFHNIRFVYGELNEKCRWCSVNELRFFKPGTEQIMMYYRPSNVYNQNNLGIETYKKFNDFLENIGVKEFKFEIFDGGGYCLIDYTIQNLDGIIKIIREYGNIVVSQLLWQALITEKRSVTFKWSRPDGRYNFTITNNYSTLISKLSNESWIPDKGGIFYKPQEMSQDMLPPEFPYDDQNGLLTAIGFGLNAKNASTEEKENRRKRNDAAETFGFESPEEADKMAELARTLKESGESPDSLIAKYALKPSFPSKQSPNPERRAQHISQEITGTNSKTYEKRERSVRISAPHTDPKIYLKQQYTNEDNIIVCQICQEEMPFKKKNGEYYFESVEIFDKGTVNAEHDIPYLALCPICAAKYNEFVKNGDDSQLNGLKKSIPEYCFEDSSDKFCIAVKLDSEASIRFTEQHLKDVQTIIRAL